MTELVDRVEEFLAGKRPGDVDIAEVQDIKRMIRESEAVAGPAHAGTASEGAARFLDLPFYQTGKVRKDPIGPADVAIVRALLEERPARPDLRRRRPLRPARHPPDVQGGDRPRAGGGRRGRACRAPRCGSTAAPGRSGR